MKKKSYLEEKKLNIHHLIKGLRVVYVFFFLGVTTLHGELKSANQVLLINDTSSWYHWGCTGTSSALKEGIEAHGFLLKRMSISDVYALKHLPKSPQDFDDIKFFRAFSKANPLVIDLMQSADCLIINGEGTIHGGFKEGRIKEGRNGPMTLLYLAYIGKRVLKKHVEIVNHSCFPHDHERVDTCPMCTLYQKVYKGLDFVAVRDTLSMQTMKHLKVEATLSFDCLPLYIEAHYKHKKPSKTNNYLLAGSVAWNEEGMIKIIEFLKQKRRDGYQIQVLVGAQDYPARDDRLLVDFLKKHFDGNWELLVADTMEEWLQAIDQASFLISGCFHHTIAALCLGTPCLPLNSNTPKMDALMLMVHQPLPLSYQDQDLLYKLKGYPLSIPNACLLERFCRLAKKNL